MRYFGKYVAVFVICIIASNLYAEKMTIVWEKEFGDDNNLSYVAHEAIFNNGTLQVIGYAFDSQTRSSGKYWFSQINPDGNVVSRDDFHVVSNVRPSDIIFGSWKTKGMKVDQGNMYCAGKFGSKENSFAKLGANDKKMLKKQIPSDPNNKPGDSNDKSEEVVLKMIDLSGNKFLFVGRDAKSNGFAAKTDSDGDVYWRRMFEKSKLSFIVDAIEMENNLILLECFTDGGPNNNFYEGFNCRLIKCDSEGNIITEKSFTGGGAFPNKYPELHKVDSNSFLVGYDKQFKLNQMEYCASAYDNYLKLLSERTIINKEVKTPFYTHILPVSSGGFIAAYNDSLGKITVSKYSGSGELLTSLSLDNYFVVDDFRIADSSNKYFVIALSMPSSLNNLVKTKIAFLSIE
jgi:hypothetical protein